MARANSQGGGWNYSNKKYLNVARQRKLMMREFHPGWWRAHDKYWRKKDKQNKKKLNKQKAKFEQKAIDFVIFLTIIALLYLITKL